jgi:hypothetical protein
MRTTSDDIVWDRITSGRATVLLGGTLPAPPAGRVVLVVPCDRPQRDLGAILEARRRIERRIGHQSTFWELAADRVRSSIRHRLLADEPELERAWMLLEPLNRLQEESDAPAALVFEIAEAADPASLALLEEVIGHPGRAGAALVFVIRDPHPEGPAARLVAAVRRVEGGRGIVDLRAPLKASAPPPKAAKKPRRRAAPWTAEHLPRELRRVARAAAIVGDCFEIDLVAGLLRISELDVLEAFQELVDAGAPFEDLGQGAFQLEPAAASLIRAGVQPSLAVAWNVRLAELLGAAKAEEDPRATKAAIAAVNLTITTEIPAVGAIPDPARAAAHLEAAGELDHAATGFLHAAREAMAFGADEQAGHHARRALDLLDGDGGGGPRHRAMRSEAQMIDAFVQGDAGELSGSLARMVQAQRELVAAVGDPAAGAELAHTERLLERLTKSSSTSPGG